MQNKIGIIGMGGTEKIVAEALKDKGIDVIIIDETNTHTHDKSFELNGVRYAPIKPNPVHKHVSSKLGGIMAMGSMVYLPYVNDLYGEGKYTRKLPEGTDILKEYGLIQNKQSKLSKWDRDMVVAIFEKQYYRLP